MESNAPIFIVGANRSGTTLLRLILNAHPRLAIPEELDFFNPWIAGHWHDVAPNREAFCDRVHGYLHTKLPSEAFEDVDLDTLEAAVVEQASTYDWRALYGGMLQWWAHRHGKSRWGEKTPGNLFYVDTLRAMFPDARFIHLVRDPRPGVQSMQNTSFFGNDVIINALNRRKYLREGLRRDATMPPDCWTRVRYEDLLTATEDTMQALCRFLGEQFTPSMLTYYEDAEQYMGTAAAQSFNRAARRPIDPTRAHAWRDSLPPSDAALIETLCGPEMEALGYSLDGRSPSLSDWARLTLNSLFWQYAQSTCDAPEYVVEDSPATYLRRLPGRIRAVLSGLH